MIANELVELMGKWVQNRTGHVPPRFEDSFTGVDERGNSFNVHPCYQTMWCSINNQTVWFGGFNEFSQMVDAELNGEIQTSEPTIFWD